jgi:hypothetical protein
MSRPRCAYIFPPPFVDELGILLRCTYPADYAIVSTLDPADRTAACADHVGALLGDRSYTVTAIPEPPAAPDPQFTLGIHPAPSSGGTPCA